VPRCVRLPPAFVRLRPDDAAVLLYDAAADGEAKPGAPLLAGVRRLNLLKAVSRCISTPRRRTAWSGDHHSVSPSRWRASSDRFQQVESTDSSKKGGTGLGLAICRSIIQQHGGIIWAQPNESWGSRTTTGHRRILAPRSAFSSAGTRA